MPLAAVMTITELVFSILFRRADPKGVVGGRIFKANAAPVASPRM